MARYTHYVKCCLTAYYKTGVSDTSSLKDAALKDWQACHDVLVRNDVYTSEELKMFRALFTSPDDIRKVIEKYAKENSQSQDYVWNKVKELERRIAVARGIYDP